MNIIDLYSDFELEFNVVVMKRYISKSLSNTANTNKVRLLTFHLYKIDIKGYYYY